MPVMDSMAVAAMAMPYRPASVMGDPDRDAHGDHRQGGGLHGDADAGDDVGGMAGLRGRGDVAHRRVLRGGVVLGDHDHRRRQRQPHERSAEQIAGTQGAVAHHAHGDEVEGNGSQHAGYDHALVERVHDLAAFLRLHEEGADDRRDDGRAAQHERIEDAVGPHLVDHQGSEHHGRDDGHGVGLEQVGRHAGAVADVVAHVVGDHRGVARVVFRNAGFDLAHEVGADVRPLGEDAAAQPREDRDERRTEGESDQRRASRPSLPCPCRSGRRSSRPRPAGPGPPRACR